MRHRRRPGAWVTGAAPTPTSPEGPRHAARRIAANAPLSVRQASWPLAAGSTWTCDGLAIELEAYRRTVVSTQRPARRCSRVRAETSPRVQGLLRRGSAADHPGGDPHDEEETMQKTLSGAPAVPPHGRPHAAAGATVSRQWARFLDETRFETLPAAVVDRAKIRILDEPGHRDRCARSAGTRNRARVRRAASRARAPCSAMPSRS